jgi:hypothetical protein
VGQVIDYNSTEDTMDIQSTISGKNISITLRCETPLEDEIIACFKDRAVTVKVEPLVGYSDGTIRTPNNLMVIRLGNGKESTTVPQG